jgi:hypothetical protein
MAKEKKVNARETPKYSTSSDEDSSDDEVDYTSLFKGLDRAKVEKINESIDALNEKDRLLERQEDILYEEHDKFISVQKSLALDIKRDELLSSELSTCNKSISSLKTLNDDLNAKLEVVSKSSPCVEHTVICDRCKDFNIDACVEHLTSISKLNDEVASLNVQLKTCKNDFDKLKFARDAYIVGRHPSIKDGLGFKKEAKNLTSQRAPIFNKEKGTAPMASCIQRNHAFIYDRKVSRNTHYTRSYGAYDSHAMIASSSTFVHGRSRPKKGNVIHHVPKKMPNESATVFHACNTNFVLSCKNKKVVARKLGAKCKGDKTCIWVPKDIVTNLVGPNKSWVPKTQA